ncbi:DUF3396 domain-containing protein [Archangium sp.]|jgi:hypothetical protein|uniref:DUF3396 domain-containing protein n=1 Tax=Archangium sp. TaxID=1872627 RepID=UPI002ED9F1F2
MSEHYPRIRAYTKHGYLLMREGLSINFFMRCPHVDVAQAVMGSLDAYLRAVGPGSIGQYTDDQGEQRALDDSSWEFIRHQLLKRDIAFIKLHDALSCQYRYRFEYCGHSIDDLCPEEGLGAGCAVSFWLPTEYLEEHGPGRVRELALELAAPLPFCSGHAGLSFNGENEPLSMRGEERKLCFRYPGLDVPNPGRLSWRLGTRVRGAYWLTFLGQPVLGELGGTAGLRSRLLSPSTTVQELEGARAVVTLGKWPEAGDTEQGLNLPAYRELARVLEPWLYHEELGLDFEVEETRRWERRFLD